MQAAMLLMMVACSTDFGDSMLPQDDDKAVPKAQSEQVTYEGEWTCDKQVIDTARLEVTNVLRLRLPEEYLRNLCFPTQSSYTLMGQPAAGLYGLDTVLCPCYAYHERRRQNPLSSCRFLAKDR